MALEVVVTVTYGMTASTIILNKINFLKAKISSDSDAADNTEHRYLPKKELHGPPKKWIETGSLTFAEIKGSHRRLL